VLVDSGGRSLGRVELPNITVLPESVREFKVAWVRPLDPGAYTARATLDFGGPVLLVGETRFVRRP